MTGRLIEEGTLTLKEAAARLSRPGRRPVHHHTVRRWLLVGVLGRSGERIKLEAVRVGGAWMTTAEALNRFFAALTQDGAGCDVRSQAGADIREGEESPEVQARLDRLLGKGSRPKGQTASAA